MFSNCSSFSKPNVSRVVLIGVVFALFGCLVQISIARAQDEFVPEVIKAVKLVPQGIGENLKVDKPNQCRKDKHEGCLLFERGKLGRILFHLPGSKNQNKYCPDADHVITKIEATAYSTDATKGDFTGPFPLPGWLKENAFPDIDLDTGIVYEAGSLNVARSQEWITNLNDHENPIEEADVIKSFWYRVTVTACNANQDGTHTAWVSDPRGDNEGKN